MAQSYPSSYIPTDSPKQASANPVVEFNGKNLDQMRNFFVDQARKTGFHLNAIDEIEENRTHLEDGSASPVKESSLSDLDKKGSDEFVEAV